jgi:hypothetical protein
MRFRGHPGDDRSALDVGHHAGLAGRRGPVADDHAVADADLSCECHALPDLRRSGDSDLSADDRVLPHGHVVTDLHQIVDLRPAPDPGFRQRRPVDAGIGPDVNVVFEHDDPDLRNTAVLPPVPYVAESVGAHDRAGQQAAPGTDPAAGGDDAHADPGIVAD